MNDKDTQRTGTSGHGTELLRRGSPAGLEGLVIDIAGYREHLHRPTLQIETASLVVPLIISFGEPFEIALGREPSAGDRFGSFAAGLCTRPALIGSGGAAHCMQVNFTPLGARRFFGLPMGDIAERMVAVGDLDDRGIAGLRDRLGETEGWAARFSVIETFVRERLARGEPASPATEWTYRRIVATGGRASVTTLADRVGWSRKHLAARFRDEVGLTPKAVARLVRFADAQAMARTTQEGWAGIAAACGYADQAHLVREFREFAGEPPVAWRARAA